MSPVQAPLAHVSGSVWISSLVCSFKISTKSGALSLNVEGCLEL